jgi:predicted anti-sigma-YlaC factor YlaD
VTCRQVVQLLTDYLEGALSDADRVRVQEHLAGCAACRAFLGQLRAAGRVTAALAAAEVPAALRAELISAFRDWRTASSPEV